MIPDDSLLLQILLHTKEAAVVFVSEDLRIGYINKAMQATWRRNDSVVGKRLIDAAPEFEEFIPALQKVWRTGETYRVSDTPASINVNGVLVRMYFDIEFRAVFDKNGQTIAIINTSTNVTERREVQASLRIKEEQEQALHNELTTVNKELAAINKEQAAINEELQQTQLDLLAANTRIAESEARFRNMAEASDILIATSDEQMQTSYLNSAWYELTGVSIEHLLKFGWVGLLHPDDKEPFLSRYLSAFNQRIYFTGEFRIKNRAGEYRWLFVRCPPLFRPDGSFAGYIASAIDVTEQKADEQRKNDFIGMVSHEMKTPITSLRGYLQLLRAKTGTEDSFTQNMLAKAEKQVNRITSLINGFLNVSRLESGKIHIDMQRFDLAELVKESEEETKSLYNTHRIVFAPVETTFVNADRDKIAQVISNLISNAVKYSSPGTEINVACITKDETAVFSVKDRGIGIQEENIPRLFERYYRVNEGTNTASGFGIGLYLCYEIIQRHNGKIWAESEMGKGSMFLFSLPVIQ